MSSHIDASWDRLYADAKDTTEDYFDRAKRVLSDSKLPYNAADVVALAAVMCAEFRSSVMAVGNQKVGLALNSITDGLETIAAARNA